MRVNRYCMLVCGVVVMMLVSVNLAWSIFVAPLEADFGWTRSQTQGICTLATCMFCVGSFVGGTLMRRFSPGFVVRLSALAFMGGFCCAGLLSSMLGLYIGYGLMVGFAIGCGYNGALSSTTLWFLDNRGLSSGVMLMGFGFGGMLLSAVASVFLQNFTWQTTFLLLGGGIGTVLFMLSFFFSLPPEVEQAVQKQEQEQETADTQKQYSTLEMLKRQSFYYSYIWLVIIAGAGFCVTSNAAPMASELGASIGLIAFAPGLVSLCNGAGRLFFGRVYDIAGRRFTTIIMPVIAFTAMLMLTLAFSLRAIPFFILGASLGGLAFGGMAVTNTTDVGVLYGAKHYAVNLSVMSTNSVWSALLGNQLPGMLYDATGGYLAICMVFMGLSSVALACALLVKKA